MRGGSIMPYLYYLSYLISLGMSEVDIILHMQDLGFSLEREEIDNLKKGMLLPRIFDKYSEGEAVDQGFIIKYARQMNMGEIWKYKLTGKPKAIKEMLDLVKRKNIRLVPVILALKGDEAVFDEMKEIGLEYSKRSIQLMFHYFFNIERINLSGWRDYFAKHAPPVIDLLDKPLNYIRYYFGITPGVPYTKMLKDLMHYGYYKALDLLDSNSKEQITMGKKMADLAIKAGERFEKHNKGDINSFLEDVELEFESAEIGIPSIEAIETSDEKNKLKKNKNNKKESKQGKIFM